MSQSSHDLSDLVVIGGGPVGLYSAALAASHGLSVTVVEARANPVDKACGEGLMSNAVRLLQHIGVDPKGRDFTGITYLDAIGEVRAYAPFGHGPGRGVRRLVLQDALAHRAKEMNVQRIQGRALKVTQNREAVTAHLADGTAVRGRYLAGADGLHSTVRRCIGVPSHSPSTSRFGLRQHFAVAPWTDSVEVYWAPHAEAYVTPVADDVVGVAILGGPTGESFNDRISAFPALAQRLGNFPQIGPVLGSGPLRQRVNARVSGRVLLVGDAAGYVDALTGEGLAVGFSCATSLISAVRTGDTSRYERDWRRITREYRWMTGVLVAAARRQFVRRHVVSVAARNPRLFTTAVNRLG